MSWTRTNPGAGDPWGIRHLASVRLAGADQLRTTTLTNVQSAVNDASSASWTAQAATAFASTAQGLIPEVQVIITGLETDAGALNQYAAMVEQIHDQAVGLQRQDDDARAEQARLRRASMTLPYESSGLWTASDPDTSERARLEESLKKASTRLALIEVRWDGLAYQRQAADDACIATLASVGSRGNLAGLGRSELSSLNTAGLLQKLGGLTATEMTIVVENNPGLAEKFWNSPPDAARVETWWAGLEAAAQAALVVTVPIVIGNLEGVPYASRVQANKHNISAGIATLEREVAELEATVEESWRGSPSLRAANEASVRIAQEQIDCYKDLRDEITVFYDPTTGQKVSVTGHNVLVFDHAHDAIAEYSGLLDPGSGSVPAGVKSVGLYIPGTNTTLGNFDEEVQRSEWFVANGDRGDVGMITWKGGAFPQWGEAVSGGMADKLGQRLAYFGQGVELANTAALTGVGYSAGGSIMGAAERAGLPLDRAVHVSSAGMGLDVRDLDDYPTTSDVPHYAMIAPGDYIVGPIQGVQLGDWGHGSSPLTSDGFTRLETGYLKDGEVTSGQVRGHSGSWIRGSTAMEQINSVIVGGQVELYAVPEKILTDHTTGQSVYSNPVMEPGYEPNMVDVRGGEE